MPRLRRPFQVHDLAARLVDDGETLEQAARRELSEELDLLSGALIPSDESAMRCVSAPEERKCNAARCLSPTICARPFGRAGKMQNSPTF